MKRDRAKMTALDYAKAATEIETTAHIYGALERLSHTNLTVDEICRIIRKYFDLNPHLAKKPSPESQSK